MTAPSCEGGSLLVDGATPATEAGGSAAAAPRPGRASLAWVFVLAARNAGRRRERTLGTLLMIAFSVGGLMIARGLCDDLVAFCRETEIAAHTGHLQIRSASESNGVRDLVAGSDALAGRLWALPSVARLERRRNFGALLSTGERSVAVGAMALDLRSKSGSLPPVAGVSGTGARLLDGRPLSDAEPGILIGRGVADALKLHVGDGVILLARTADEDVNGRDAIVRGIVSTGVPEWDDSFVAAPLGFAQSLLRSDGVDTIVLWLGDTRETEAARKTIAPLVDGDDIQTWSALSDYPKKMADFLGRWFSIVELIVIVVAFIGIHGAVRMAVAERSREIGTLRALGQRRSRIVLLFLVEGALIAAAGVAAGLAGSGLLIAAGRWAPLAMPPLPGFAVPWSAAPLWSNAMALRATAIVFASALFSSVGPSLSAARLSVADALRT